LEFFLMQMTSSTFADQYTLPSGEVLEVPYSTLQHLQAHPEVTPEILETAMMELNPPSSQGVSMIDLKTKFGFWGKSGLVEVPEVTLFAFRKERITPSSVVDHLGVPASKLAVVTKPKDEGGFLLISCWCTDGVPAKPEPITQSVDPRTNEGLLLRQDFIHFWSRHALALGVTPIEGKPFTSTWEEVIARWGDIYHTS
jgi:hypothetical protein